MAGSERQRKRIRKFLGKGPSNWQAIYDHVNTQLRHGITSSELNSLLGNSIEWHQIERTKSGDHKVGVYAMVVA